MKIVIAPDSFKGSLSAWQASVAIEQGIKKVLPKADTHLIPVGDGGEGTMNSLVLATSGKKVEFSVTGPLHAPVKAEYGILGDQKTCVIEMASASGLCLIPSEQRDPMITTTYGTGELIKKALDDGCRRIILAVGGSATNDGGIGMLQALGMKLLDAEGNPVGLGARELQRIAEINDCDFDPRVSDTKFVIASDVQNPLIGPHGSSYVFGPQKGATPETVEILDTYLTGWANLVESKTGVRLHDKPGAGAAGGIGGAFQAFFPAVTRRGIDIVIEYTKLGERLAGADLVFTGEGQIDFQTASGKTPMGVAQEAQKYGIPVFVLAGSIGKGIDTLYQYGINSIHSIVSAPISLQEAMEKGAELLTSSAEQVLRAYLASVSPVETKK
ncbi:glycerate kinase [Bacillus taeanensis]|uniref:Glycerate kinase n=1 Tax=Bacillus taeanensis TaxID=273032 RepID=A0A366XVM0_9BACI|nr:glycerate kinase [Bacillus taeanensis]RBW68203.1 glycerate kinase [Bacillus taeanensis]